MTGSQRPFRLGMSADAALSPHYSGAFAFSTFLYPRHRPRSLRFRYHRSGVHGAYPVDQGELKRLGVGAICDPAGVMNTAVWSATTQSYLRTVLVMA